MLRLLLLLPPDSYQLRLLDACRCLLLLLLLPLLLLLLNSDDFPSSATGGLQALAQALHRRCARIVELQSGRLRT